MTLEELQAKVEALESEKDSIASKNRELLNELKTVRAKVKEVDIDAYYKAIDELENIKAENGKLQNEVKLKAKDYESLNKMLSEKDGHLQKLIIDDGLTNSLTKIGVKPELLPAVKALLRGQTELKDNQAVIGDKALNDFIGEWANTEGKAYISAPNNSGSGANGGNGVPSQGKLDGTKAEQEAYIKQKFNL